MEERQLTHRDGGNTDIGGLRRNADSKREVEEIPINRLLQRLGEFQPLPLARNAVKPVRIVDGEQSWLGLSEQFRAFC